MMRKNPNEKLIEGIEKGRFKDIKKTHLNNIYNFNKLKKTKGYGFKCSILSYFVISEDWGGLNFVLKMDPNTVNVFSEHNETPLYLAIQYSSAQIINLFLAKQYENMCLIAAKSGEIPLHAAVMRGLHDCIRELLKNNPDQQIMTVNAEGKLPFHFALCKGDLITAEKLLQHKREEQLNAVTLQSENALDLALDSKNEDVIQFIIKYKPELLQCKLQNTPLIRACHLDNLKIVNLLLGYGVTITNQLLTPSAAGEIPLWIAIKNGNSKIVEALLKNNAAQQIKYQLNGEDALFLVCQMKGKGKLACVKLIMAIIKKDLSDSYSMTSVNLDNKTILHVAMENLSNGDDKIIEELLQYQTQEQLHTTYEELPFLQKVFTDFALLNLEAAKVILTCLTSADLLVRKDEEEPLAIHTAIENGDEDLIPIFIEKCPVLLSQKYHGDYPIHAIAKAVIADEMGEEILFNILKKYPEQIDFQNDEGYSLIHLAVNDSKFLKQIMKYNPNLLHCDRKGNLPIHNAFSTHDSHLIIGQLLQQKIREQIDAINNAGDSILLLAARDDKHFLALQIIFEIAIKINEIFANGWTPLHESCARGQVKNTQYLLTKELPICTDKDDHTPLYYAVKNNHKELVILLMNNGVSLNLEIKELFTAAILNRNQEMVNLLVSMGGNLKAFTNETNRSQFDSKFLHYIENPSSYKQFFETLKVEPNQKVSSGIGYLLNEGKSIDEIKTLQQPYEEEETEEIKPQKAQFSWYNQSFDNNDEMMEVTESNSSPNTFVYLDLQQLIDQGIDPQAIKNCRYAFDGINIKTLTGKPFMIPVTQPDGTVNNYPAKHELKVGPKERVLLLEVPSDPQPETEKRATVYLGAIYLPDGLHENADSKSIMMSVKNQPAALPIKWPHQADLNLYHQLRRTYVIS